MDNRVIPNESAYCRIKINSKNSTLVAEFVNTATEQVFLRANNLVSDLNGNLKSRDIEDISKNFNDKTNNGVFIHIESKSCKLESHQVSNSLYYTITYNLKGDIPKIITDTTATPQPQQ